VGRDRRRATAPVQPQIATTPDHPVRSAARSAIINTAIAGLLTLGCVSAVYLVATSASKLNDIYDFNTKQTKADAQWIAARSEYAEQMISAQKRAGERYGSIQLYAGQISDYKQLVSPQLGDKLHKMSAFAQEEAGKDKGALSAYLPAQTNLPPEYHQVEISSLSDEITMWKSLDLLIETVQHEGDKSLGAERAYDAWQNAFLKMLNDITASQKSWSLLLSRIPAEDTELQTAQAQMTRDFVNLRRRIGFALAGLIFSVVSLSVIGLFTFFGRKQR
jgi:hypothetical protein